jgi:hypothetical protein
MNMGELVQYENKYYQWVKGDYTGRIETVSENLDENGLNFVVFESGKRINADLLLEYLMEVPEHQAKIAEESAIIDDQLPNNVAPINNPVAAQPAKQTVQSPVMQLLLNQKNESINSIEVSLEIKIPRKEMVEVLKGSFGEEIEEDLYQYIHNQLEYSVIKETVQEKIKKFIQEYYEPKS